MATSLSLSAPSSASTSAWTKRSSSSRASRRQELERRRLQWWRPRVTAVSGLRRVPIAKASDISVYALLADDVADERQYYDVTITQAVSPCGWLGRRTSRVDYDSSYPLWCPPKARVRLVGNSGPNGPATTAYAGPASSVKLRMDVETDCEVLRLAEGRPPPIPKAGLNVIHTKGHHRIEVFVCPGNTVFASSDCEIDVNARRGRRCRLLVEKTALLYRELGSSSP